MLKVANNVKDKGDCITGLLIRENVPICCASSRTGQLVARSRSVHGKLMALLKISTCASSKTLGGSLLTSCVFSSSSRTTRIGTVIRPIIHASFLR